MLSDDFVALQLLQNVTFESGMFNSGIKIARSGTRQETGFV